MGTFTLPNGKQYESGKPVKTRSGLAAEAADARTLVALAKAGNAVLKEAERREQVAKALEDAAGRWEQLVLLQPAAVSEYKSYLSAKARSARDKAAAVRRGEKV
jgi:hypothetical protein